MLIDAGHILALGENNVKKKNLFHVFNVHITLKHCYCQKVSFPWLQNL